LKASTRKTKTTVIISLVIMISILSFYNSIDFGKTDTYPATGGDWYNTENSIITEDFELTGNIYNYDTLRIENCKITIKNNIYSLTSSSVGALTLVNIIVEGIDTSGGSNYGGMNIRNNGLLNLNNVTFKTMKTYAVYTTSSFVITNCTFDTLSGKTIQIESYNEAVPLEDSYIKTSNFKNIPLDYSIYVTRPASVTYTNWTIENCNVSNAGGFYLGNVQESLIKNNIFTNSKLKGIYFNSHARNNTVENNQFINTPTCIYAINSEGNTYNMNIMTGVSDYGFKILESEKNVLMNNRINLTGGIGIYTEDYRSYHETYIVNCSININSTSAVQALALGETNYQFYSPPNRTVTVSNDTTINGKAVRYYSGIANTTLDLTGVEMSKLIMINCTNVSLIGAKVEGYDGMYFANLINCTIANVVSSNNYYNGIETDLCKYTKFINFTTNNNRHNGFAANKKGTYEEHNKFNKFINGVSNNNSWYGFPVRNHMNTLIFNLTSSTNKKGIELQNGIYEMEILNSTFNNNTKSGIHILTSTNLTISNSKFNYNKEKNLYMQNTNNGTISYNEFIKNFDTTSFNVYVDNNLSNIHHNHYSDYIGFDDNNDGFGDNPYRLNATWHEAEIYDNFTIFQDFDGDKLEYFMELKFGTDTTNNDTDSDGLTDYQEIFLPRAFKDNVARYIFTLKPTNPLNNDTDGDGLNDYLEMMEEYSNPNEVDTDNDGFSDLLEHNSNTNASSSSDWPGKANQSTTVQEKTSTVTEPTAERSVMSVPGYPLLTTGILMFSLIGILMKRISKQLINSKKEVL
jgi:parallel beta-helix repeat protein